MGFFRILDSPYNSISVTVLLPSSILDIEPRQMYTASVSNRLDRFCWLIFCSWRNCFSLAPIILHFWAGVVDSRFIFSPFCLVIGQYLCLYKFCNKLSYNKTKIIRNNKQFFEKERLFSREMRKLVGKMLCNEEEKYA